VSILDAVGFSMRCKVLTKFFVTGFFSPFFVSALGDSRRSKLQETDDLERHPPKRFFNPSIFHRKSVSRDSNSQVGKGVTSRAYFSLYHDGA
jgi:hypothetical protein